MNKSKGDVFWLTKRHGCLIEMNLMLLNLADTAILIYRFLR
jgi:hypothetical protein